MDAEEIARRWWAGFNEDGVPPMELCHPEVEMANPPEFPVRGTYRGRDGIRQWAEEVWDVIDECRMEMEDVLPTGDDDVYVMMLRVRGVARHSRIPIDETWAAIWTTRDGMLYRAQGYVSRREALRAAGLRD